MIRSVDRIIINELVVVMEKVVSFVEFELKFK